MKLLLLFFILVVILSSCGQAYVGNQIKTPDIYQFSKVPQIDICIVDIKTEYDFFNNGIMIFKNAYYPEDTDMKNYFVDTNYLRYVTDDIKQIFKEKNYLKEDECKITYNAVLKITYFKFVRAILHVGFEFSLVGVDSQNKYYSYKEDLGINWNDVCVNNSNCNDKTKEKDIIYFANYSLQTIAKTFADNLKIDIFNKMAKKEFRKINGIIVDENNVELDENYFNKDETETNVVSEKKTSKEKQTVMLKVVTKEFEMDKDEKDILRSGLEDKLTQTGYSIISEKAQEEALIEQAQQRKKECYDEECIVDVGKMIAARFLCLVDIKKTKNSENYVFQLKFIDIESGETIKSRTNIYKQNITDIESLLLFSKKSIVELLN